jgi:hypothetical protein
MRAASAVLVSAAVPAAVLALAATRPAAPSRDLLAERVLSLTRGTPWTLVGRTPVEFTTHHPQGMVKIGETFFVSSVEIRRRTRRYPQPVDGLDRDAGEGVGHLFKFDQRGKLIADLTLGEGTIYHPGGIDYDGRSIWVPVAEYRPDSRSIVYRVDPETMKASEVLRVPDHLGAVVVDPVERALHAVSWGSRRFYRWDLDAEGRAADAGAAPRMNPSHYVDYQDCKYAGARRMLCTGVAEIRGTAGSGLRLGGVELIDLRDARPLHQVPLLLSTESGLPMTQNPAWLEPSPAGLRAWFMPEDDRSTMYVYEATLP